MFVYQLQRSLYSCKLRVAMALKGVDIPLRDPPGGGYRSAEYRAIVAAGIIPALIDGDFVLAESDAIIEYLDERFDGPGLLPGPARRRALARMISRYHDLHLEPVVRALFPIVGDADAMRAAAPSTIEKQTAKLSLIDGALDAAGPFATGAEPTLADCGLPVTLIWIAALAPGLGAPVALPAKVARVRDALRRETRLAGLLAEYEGLVAAWVASRG